MYRKIALIVIILIAASLRFYQLGQNPPSLYWDEVALGYNAYSLSETARDEEGVFLPYQYIRSFGDFKPIVYSYLDIVPVKLFGLSEWSTRFPSAFFGTITVLLTYLLVQQMFNKNSLSFRASAPPLRGKYSWGEAISTDKLDVPNNQQQTTNNYLPLLSALLLAISPWHTQLSRVAYEANIALFFVVLGVYFFFKFINTSENKILNQVQDDNLELNKNQQLDTNYFYLIFSAISFVITLYTFNSNRIFTPLLILLLIILYWKNLFSKLNIRTTIISLIIGILLTAPLLPHIFSPEGKLRFNEVNIFTDYTILDTSNQRIERAGNTWWAKILNNRRLLYGQEILNNYFSHFNGRFLFITGDLNPRFSIQDVGEMYIVEFPFLLFGLYLFATRRKKEYLFILGWMLLAPIPTSVTRENPHALRTLNMLPTLQIITATGFIYTLTKIKNYNYQTIFNRLKLNNYLAKKTVLITTIGVFSIFLSLQVIYYLHNYYVHYPQNAFKEWQYGYKQMVQKLEQIQGNYDRIVITQARGRPYINVLFYSKYSPALFQKERHAIIDQGFGFVIVDNFNKYYFKEINWKNEIANNKNDQKTLIIGNDQELQIDPRFTKAVIYDLKNEPVFIFNEVPTGYQALQELGFKN